MAQLWFLDHLHLASPGHGVVHGEGLHIEKGRPPLFSLLKREKDYGDVCGRGKRYFRQNGPFLE